MKVNLIFLLLFITICFSSISQTQKPDSIVVTMDKQTKRNIDKYNNFWYLFPYVTVYDSHHPNGIEILNKQSLKDTITTLLFSTEDDFYILNCRTLQSEVEVVVKNGDKVILFLNNEQIAINVTNRTTQPLEFKVDEILYHRQKTPLILVKKYYNPLHFMSIEEALKTPKKKYLVKKQAFEEIAVCIKSATQIVDSLEQNALISSNTASFNKTKFKTFLLSLNILESKINFDSARILLNSYPNTLLYPDKYHYKLAECITDKFIVEKAKEIPFNDLTNRDYAEIYDKINQSDLFLTRHKNFLLMRELDRIFKSFSRNISKKYYDSFLTNTQDSTAKNIVRDKYAFFFTPINNRDEVLSVQNQKQSLSELLKENKLTYVDFWASWCGPCRVEVPHSKKLQEKYEKDINFIYLSIDQNATQWKTAINQLTLPLKKNFLITNPKNSTLIQKYKVISIPRYMIIDAKGVVINQNAPRPSDPRLIKVFDELLKK